jgi:alkanesulfonate monooxygenase SsuD/methylene tetrahydromethanopterin reductase-like flavin-dependent oxidoreductase (luciferase family)
VVLATTSRSPQGRPVTIQVGVSGAFIELAAQCADTIFASEKPRLAAAQAYYSHIKDRVVAYGRRAESPKVQAGLQPVLGASQKEADELLAELT